MKKILLFIFFIFYYFSYGQDLYEIYINNFSFNMTDRIGSKSRNSNIQISIYFTDGSYEVLYHRYIPRGGRISEINYNKKIITNKIPSRLEYYLFINWRGKGSTGVSNYSINANICDNKIITEDFSDKLQNFKYNLKIVPIHTLNSELNNNIYNFYLPENDKIYLFAKKGLGENLYNYQYSFTPSDDNSWIDISKTLQKSDTLFISANDLNISDKIGQKVYFRVVSCYDTNDFLSKSNILPLTIIKSAPAILSHNITAPLCFDDNGSVTLTFDRMLLPEENADFILNGEYLQDKDPTLHQNLVEQLKNSTTITLPNIEPGNHNFRIVGTYKGNPTYSSNQQTVDFTITPPSPVEFSVTSSKNVFCYGGNDGFIELKANGGLGNYQYTLDNGSNWINFEQNNSTTINNLEKGIYNIKVRDKNFCIAKENNNEKEISIEIKQPNAPLSIEHIEIAEPKGYGLSNGYISIIAKGGTAKPDGTYHYEWRKDAPNGTILTDIDISPDISNGFTFRLNNVSAGKYYLTIKDHLYATASSSLESCGIILQEFIVSQPDPLISNIEISKKISCHIDNKYDYKIDLNANGIPDEAEDGALKVIAQGGVPPYTYQWQKEIDGTFQNILGAIEWELVQQSIGKYKILVTDINGNTTSSEYTFDYPEELKIRFKNKDLLCYSGNDGEAEVFVTGGTGNYTYRWNNLDKSSKNKNLSAGNYFVLVSDEHQCKVSGNITINEPEEIIITDILVQNPLFPNASNGQIHLDIKGGKAPYSITWSNGMTGAYITGLPEGIYIANILDANGCILTKTYTLTDPERLPLDLGEDVVTLCLGDVKTYNVKINDPSASYIWTDKKGNIISTQPEITLSHAGTYTITIINSAGNTASDSVEIKLSSEILKPEFMIATHAYKEYPVKLVNTSSIPPQKVEWIIPQNQDIKIISQTDEYLEVLFSSVGAYNFGLKGIQGKCEKTFYKNIIVEENTSGININPSTVSNIKDFIIAPNPNQGQFTVFIKLHQPKSIKLRLMDLISHEVMTPVIKPQSTEFEIPFNLGIASSTYLLILETGGEIYVQKLLIAQ